MSQRQEEAAVRATDRVPLFGTWRRAYISVVAAFVIYVALFYAFERYFS